MNVLVAKPPGLADVLEGIVAELREAGACVAVMEPAAALREADVWDIVGGPGWLACDEAYFAARPRLRCVVAAGSGVEGVDLAAATRAGVLVAHGGTRENVEGMAEATVMAMLALLHDLKGAEGVLRGGGTRRAPGSLYDATAGLIGFGAIGREVARLLQAWRVQVLVCSPQALPGQPVAEGAVGADLDALLAASDIVSLHARLDAGTRGLMSAAHLGRMRRGAYLINFARGGLLDEQALAEALVEGRLAGAALDVFETEPLAPDSPLRTAPNLILTPHNIGHTRRGAQSVAAAFAGNISDALAGRPPALLRNPEAVDVWLERASEPSR